LNTFEEDCCSDYPPSTVDCSKSSIAGCLMVHFFGWFLVFTQPTLVEAYNNLEAHNNFESMDFICDTQEPWTMKSFYPTKH
jgi:hypothetical protein